MRDDSSCSPADLLYGSSLRLPADLMDNGPFTAATSAFVNDLRGVMRSSQPMPFAYHGHRVPQVPRDLQTCSHVFVRIDAVRRPLSPPYEGPFPVLSRTPKTFVLDKSGKTSTVTVDRLKPAFSLLVESPSPASITSPESTMPATVPSPDVASPPSPASSSVGDVAGARSLDPAEWPLPTRSGRVPRPVKRLGFQ